MDSLYFDIKSFRNDLNLKQNELASMLGIPQGYLSQIENGKRKAPDYLINKLREICDKNFDNYYKQRKTIDNINFDNETEETDDSRTIKRLVFLLEKSEERIERLEKENAKLKEQLNKK